MTRTIEYVLHGSDHTGGHALGVTCLAQNSAGVMYSGGRDGRIVAWANTDSAPCQAASTSAHNNWITGLVAAGRNVVSCSNDTTVNLWNESLTTFEKLGDHNDYATALALMHPTEQSAADLNYSDDYTVVSGGLDGHIYGWSPASPGKAKFDFHIPGDGGSVYSIAASHSLSLIASGTPDSIVRLWDPRQPAKPVQRFTGHTDNIRALAVANDWLLSASSDSTVRLWNITSGRLFKTYSEHSQSVWSLLVGSEPPDRGAFLSADRAGVIIANSPDHSETILTVGAGVTDMAVSSSMLYTAASSPTLLGYDLSSTAPRPLSSPSVELKGHDGLRKYRLLNDKRRALTLDTAGTVNMIDITRGIRLDYTTQIPGNDPDSELDMILQEVNTEHVLENWCHVSVRAGQLVVRLEERSVGNTEVYADELAEIQGLDLENMVQDDDKRINLGQWTLSSLLSPFVKAQMEKYNSTIAAQPRATPGSASGCAPVASPARSPPPSSEDGTVDGSSGKTEKKSRLRRLFGLGKKEGTPAADSAMAGSPAPSVASTPTVAGTVGTATGSDATHTTPIKTTDPPALGASLNPAESPETDRGSVPASFHEMFANAVKLQSFAPLSSSDAPLVAFHPRTRLIVSEMVQDAGCPTCVYTQEIGKLGSPADVTALEKHLPGWAGEIVMHGNLPPRYISKIGFLVLFENKDGQEAGHMDKSRLMANPILRARKIMSYIIKQMVQNNKLPESILDEPPESVIELSCQDQVVDPNTMLSVIRTRIWRNGGEVQIHYRMLVDLLE